MSEGQGGLKLNEIEYPCRPGELGSESGGAPTGKFTNEIGDPGALKTGEDVVKNEIHEVIAKCDAKILRTADEGEVLEVEDTAKEVNEEDIWKYTFDMLEPSDMLSCSLAFPQWQKWLENKRIFYLFHKVIPFFLEYLSEQDLKNCRKVGSVWKEGLDEAYQCHPQHAHLWETEYKYVCRKDVNNYIPIFRNKFTSTESIVRFSKDMESHPGNPFPGRFVWLHCQNPENEAVSGELFAEFWNVAVQMLDTFGSCVQFATLNFMGSPPLEFSLYEIVQRCLLSLPNLKRLTIAGTDGTPFEKVPAIQLPQLPNLETLRLQLVAPALINLVLDSCCVPEKIKRLDLNILEGLDVPEALFNLPQLEVLNLNTNLGLQTLARFGNLPMLPPLSHLKLRWKLLETQDMERVLRGVERFARTLINLELFAYFEYDPQDTLGTPDAFMVNLPKLKRLSLRSYDGPLDTFSRVTEVTHLDFQLRKLRSFPGSAIEMRGFQQEYFKSNAWTIFPNLKTLNLIAPAVIIGASRVTRKWVQTTYIRHNPIKREKLEELEQQFKTKFTLVDL